MLLAMCDVITERNGTDLLLFNLLSLTVVVFSLLENIPQVFIHPNVLSPGQSYFT